MALTSWLIQMQYCILSGNDCMKPYVSSRFACSVISEMELLSFPKITDDEETRIRGFLDASSSVPLTERIKDRMIALRRVYYKAT